MEPMRSSEPLEPSSIGSSWGRREDLIPTPLRIIKRTYRDPTPIRRLTVRDPRKANRSHKYPAVEKVIPHTQAKNHRFPGFLDGHITPPSSPHPLLNQSTPSQPTTAISSGTSMSLNHQSTNYYLPRPQSLSSSRFGPRTPSLRARQQTRHCYLCFHTLDRARETYSFPTTSPSIICAVTRLPYFADHVSHLDTEQQPVFCYTCFIHIHSLQLCWSCGLTITRPEERVSCGWAWWHWGCLACLLCRAPMTPPEWCESAEGVKLGESPACRVCRREVSDAIRVNRINNETAESSLDETHDSSNGEERPGDDTSDAHFEMDGAIENGHDGNRRDRDDGVLGWLARQRMMANKGASDETLYDGACESTEVNFSVMYPPLPRWMEMLPGNVNRSTKQA